MLLLALQTTASAFRLEVRPALSAYDMYSTTFESTALFDEANPMLEYRFEAATPDEQWVDLTDCFERPASRDEAAAWARNPERLRGYLETCERPLPPRLERLRLIESHRQFDWRRGTFTWHYRDRLRWMVPL